MATPTTEVAPPVGAFATATVRVADYDVADGTRAAGMAKLSTRPSEELTAELDGAAEWLDLPADEILLAALTRTIGRTLGEGVVPIDIASERGSLLDAVPMFCASARHASPSDVLAGVHRALAGASERVVGEPSEVYLNYIGDAPAEVGPVQDTPPGLGHALEVRVYRTRGNVHIDWWYDTSRFDEYTVEELTEQFPLALVEMTSDAFPPH